MKTHRKKPFIKARKIPYNTNTKQRNEMNQKLKRLLCCAFVILISVFLVQINKKNKGYMATTLGGVRDSSVSANSGVVDELARFAVDEHNKKQNALLEFGRVVKAQEQVVAGTLHHLTIEAVDAGEKKLYQAKVWVKPWMNFKELQEFKHAGDAASFTSSDLGVKQGGHAPGWQQVPADDPQVQDAANHAIKTIQQRSNSLLPYELREVVQANAEVIEDSAKFDMLLKVKRGDKEEHFKVEVHQDSEGSLRLNQMEPHHP